MDRTTPPTPYEALVLKDERDTRVERIRLDGVEVVRKVYRTRPFLLWRTLGLASRAERERNNLAAVHGAGVPCVRPLAWSETRRFGCVVQSTLITEFVADAPSLKEWLGRLRGDDRVRMALARGLGRLLATLHEHGFLGCRITPRNVLVAGDPGAARLLLLDLPEAIGFGRSIHGRAVATIDLYDAALSASRRAQFSSSERLRILLAYCGGDRDAARALWRRCARRSRAGNRARKGWRAAIDKLFVRPFRNLGRHRLRAADNMVTPAS